MIKIINLNEDKPKRIPWNKGLTKDTDLRIANAELKKRKTNLDKYGVENVFQAKEILDRFQADRVSGKLAAKASETKKQKYGDPNYNNMAKNMATKKERYGSETYNNQNKNHETRRKNGTWNTSKPEEDYYKQLVDEYGEDNVIRQYSDPRYQRPDGFKYRCDFYIPSEDLFIEYQGHQGHGLHPYDPNDPEDIKMINHWKEKFDQGYPQYGQYIRCYTERDPDKLAIAKKNHLNYKLVYRNGLEIKI